jgi:hypothetical protein
MPDCCPLCQSAAVSDFHEDARRRYLRCADCSLVFVPEQYFLSAAAEKAEYDLHENKPDDPGYRRFLSRVYEPMLRRIDPNCHGLDFGSGPGPTLSVMLAEAGHRMAIYDIFYADEGSVLERQYDFITTTEVVEHLRTPRQTLETVWSCLKPGGTLGIMTKLVIDPPSSGEPHPFVTWHYKNDPTHICFYSAATFEWIADWLDAKLEFIEQDVIILEKGVAASP